MTSTVLVGGVSALRGGGALAPSEGGGGIPRKPGKTEGGGGPRSPNSENGKKSWRRSKSCASADAANSGPPVAANTSALANRRHIRPALRAVIDGATIAWRALPHRQAHGAARVFNQPPYYPKNVNLRIAPSLANRPPEVRQNCAVMAGANGRARGSKGTRPEIARSRPESCGWRCGCAGRCGRRARRCRNHAGRGAAAARSVRRP